MEPLGHNLLSQEEINALLTGMKESEHHATPVSDMDTVIARQESALPGSVDDVTKFSKKKHEERQRQKEENIIRKKRRASALIREILRMEEARISSIMLKKEKKINEDLYGRYEITNAGRTKMVVSMSERTVVEYRSTHPGCCIYKI